MTQDILQNLEYYERHGNTPLPYSMALDSGKPGPHLIFNGSIHGHEPAGTVAAIRLHRILTDQPEILRSGRVTFILGNPEAYRLHKRFIDENLNRAFSLNLSDSAEGRRSLEIRNYLSQVKADFLIDFHSVSVGEFKIVFYHHNTSQSLAIAESISDIPIFCEIKEQTVPHSLMMEASRYGIASISIECGNNSSLSSADTAFNHMLSALARYGMLAPEALELPKMNLDSREIEVYHMQEFIKPGYGFRFTDPDVHTGTIVAKGEIYATSENQQYVAADDYVILLPDKNPHPQDHDAGFLCKREIIEKTVGAELAR